MSKDRVAIPAEIVTRPTCDSAAEYRALCASASMEVRDDPVGKSIHGTVRKGLMKQNVSVCLTFDFDAMSVWIGTYHARSPSAISRGEFGRVGAERLLRMLREWEIRSTWFVPGHTADAFPTTVAKVAEEGHEIAHHGYFHEREARLRTRPATSIAPPRRSSASPGRRQSDIARPRRV